MSNQPARRRRRNRRKPRPASAGAQTDQPAQQDQPSQPATDESADNTGPGGGRRRAAAAATTERPRTIFGLPRTSFGLIAGLLVAMIAIFAMQLLFPPDEVASFDGVVTFADQGRRHLTDGETFTDYNSNPPTSGPQLIDPADPRVYHVDDDTVPTPPQILPLLERGGIVVYYDPDQHTADETGGLLASIESRRKFQDRLAAIPITNLAADRDDGATIVATAWRTHLPIAAWDEDGQERFREFLANAPDGYYNRFRFEGGIVALTPTDNEE